MDNGYSGGGWDHHDPELASILWPIEEAPWLRCVKDSKKLKIEMIKFIDFHELVNNFVTDKDILYDLISFQVFLLMSMDRNEKIKKHFSKWGWKEYFGKDIKSVNKLKSFQDYYFYENKIQEDDMEQWCFKAAWIGRSKGNYKCHPEFLYEGTQTIEDDKDIVYE